LKFIREGGDPVVLWRPFIRVDGWRCRLATGMEAAASEGVGQRKADHVAKHRLDKAAGKRRIAGTDRPITDDLGKRAWARIASDTGPQSDG